MYGGSPYGCIIQRARYISDKYLHVKAINLVNEAAPAIQIAQESKSPLLHSGPGFDDWLCRVSEASRIPRSSSSRPTMNSTWHSGKASPRLLRGSAWRHSLVKRQLPKEEDRLIKQGKTPLLRSFTTN
ncbi:hypothetical protein APHAL10511_003606 [Amanita phalloides]|nr:hypothetical protein APHAL10511_003606 [Amanita phalloides]